MLNNKEADEEAARLLPNDKGFKKDDPLQSTPSIVPAPMGLSSTGLKVLGLLAVQNCSKNLVMRYALQVRAVFGKGGGSDGLE